MQIENELPEHELEAARISEMLTVIALLYEHTHGEPGSGVITCPICRAGRIKFSIIARGPIGTKRAVTARCSTAGCIAFMS